LPELCNTKTDK